MTWELFQNIRRRNSLCYTVKITPQEKIFFNRAIFYTLQDLKISFAKVLYNKETKQFAINFIKQSDVDNSCLTILGLNQKNAYIYPKGCFKFFKIKSPKQDYKVEAYFDDNLKTIKFYYLG